MTGVKPLELDPDLKNIYGKLDGEDFFIVNELHQARGFRKLHIETAELGPSLEILHAVFFPYPNFDLPIFGVDIVAVPKGISAAIVDLSPVGKKLPLFIETKLKQLEKPAFKKVRELPEWGNIFSSYVHFISPINSKENASFFNLVDEYLNILISHLDSINPETQNSLMTLERYERQRYYCFQQKQNEKTRDVLARLFGSHWANQYIEMVLFDSPNNNHTLES